MPLPSLLLFPSDGLYPAAFADAPGHLRLLIDRHGNRYDVGDRITVWGFFTDVAHSATDPDAVSFSIKEPDGTVTSYVLGQDDELVDYAVGAFYAEWNLRQAGRHSVAFEGVGAVTAAEEMMFIVSSNQVPRAL